MVYDRAIPWAACIAPGSGFFLVIPCAAAFDACIIPLTGYMTDYDSYFEGHRSAS